MAHLHEGFPFISSILQAALWLRKDRIRGMYLEFYIKKKYIYIYIYLEIFILHDVYPVNRSCCLTGDVWNH